MRADCMSVQVEGFCRNVANAAARPVSFWHPDMQQGVAPGAHRLGMLHSDLWPALHDGWHADSI